MLIAAIEHCAALIVLVELLILFAGVVSRYVFGNPLTWSDDVATLLFVWLSMLGAVVALARGQHLRLTVAEKWLPPQHDLTRHLAAQLLSLIFLGSLFIFSFEHLADAQGALNPILGISEAWRAAGLSAGLGLMALFCLCQIIAAGGEAGWPRVGLAAMLAAGGSAIFYGVSWITGGAFDLALFFMGLGGACIFLGMPIAFAFGLSALAFLHWTSSVPLSIVVGRFEAGLSHLILLSIPMFVVLGLFFEATGMARTLIGFLATLIGHLRGGLSYVLLGAMYLISGISGAKAADMAAIAPALVPEMRKRGIPDGELVSLLAASSAMSETIPPSLVLITVGAVTGVSIGALFTGGLLPALVLALLLCVVARYRSGQDIALAEKASWRAVGQAVLAAIPGLLLPLIIRTAVVEGVATATEVATIGVVYTVAAGLVVYRWFDWRRMYDVLKETASLSGAIMMIFAAANAVSWALTQTGFSQELAIRITTMPGGAVSFMAISIVVFIVFGSLLEGIPAIVVFGPIAVSDRQIARHPRSPVFHGRGAGHGRWPVHATVRDRLLSGLRHRPDRRRRGDAAHLALSGRPRPRHCRRRVRAVDLHGIPRALSPGACGPVPRQEDIVCKRRFPACRRPATNRSSRRSALSRSSATHLAAYPCAKPRPPRSYPWPPPTAS